MFTGIVEELGKVKFVRKQGACLRLGLEVNKTLQGTKIGDSISVNGVCLTVVEVKADSLSFDIMPETLNSSTLKYLKIGQKLNCERALKFGDRIGGHFVTGHIDCIGVIRSKKTVRGNIEFTIGLPVAFLKYAVPKGSVALDGISLTLAKVKNGSFVVCIIPHTAKETTLGFSSSGDKVNVELDMLAKVVKPASL